jgi:hypothetical protein
VLNHRGPSAWRAALANSTAKEELMAAEYSRSGDWPVTDLARIGSAFGLTSQVLDQHPVGEA